MRKQINLVICLLMFAGLLSIFSCKKDDDENPQDIVKYDSSEYTGELTVKLYYNGNDVGNNFDVYLYTSRQDVTDGIYLYHIQTNNSGISYFGYINIGNYYVRGEGTLNSAAYESDLHVVQVRPRRQETLNINVHPK